MSRTWTIAKRELVSFFDALIAYLLLVVFLGVSGFFAWWYGSDVFIRGQADLNTFTETAYWTLFLFIPAITMRTLAEERRSGTLDLLLTKAVTERQIVLGKFIACMLLIAIALACTLPWYFMLTRLGNVDHGAIISGYLAVLMLSAGYTAIGILASSLTANQVAAFLFALLLALCFHVLFQVMAANFTGTAGHVLDALSTSSHFDAMARGVIDSRDVLYFLSITFLGLSFAEMALRRTRR